MEVLPTLVGYGLFLLAVVHAWVDAKRHRSDRTLTFRAQRLLMICALFLYGTLLEANGVLSGHYFYRSERFVNLGVVPLSVSLAWVGIIYSAMVIAERMRLSPLLRMLATSLIALSLDWGMDPIAVDIGIWVWRDTGAYFGVPSFNMLGWFFIPMAYLVAYGVAWDHDKRRPQLLSIREVDTHTSLGRKVYTGVLVTPIAFALLFGSTRLVSGVVPGLLTLSSVGMGIGAALTVGGAFAFLVWRRDYLARSHWVNLIPPVILTWIGLNYVCFAGVIGRWDLAGLMLVSGLPLWAALGFTLPSV
jgi:uncharacterized membrane protein